MLLDGQLQFTDNFLRTQIIRTHSIVCMKHVFVYCVYTNIYKIGIQYFSLGYMGKKVIAIDAN